MEGLIRILKTRLESSGLLRSEENIRTASPPMIQGTILSVVKTATGYSTE